MEPNSLSGSLGRADIDPLFSLEPPPAATSQYVFAPGGLQQRSGNAFFLASPDSSSEPGTSGAAPWSLPGHVNLILAQFWIHLGPSQAHFATRSCAPPGPAKPQRQTNEADIKSLTAARPKETTT